LLKNPLHPYTKKLLQAAHFLSGKLTEKTAGCSRKGAPAKCAYFPLCEDRLPVCIEAPPELKNPEKDHQVLCHRSQEDKSAVDDR